MAVKEILLLGNPQLYKSSESVHKDELPEIADVVADLHDTLLDFRERYGAGRAIAAPQIGVRKRLIYLHIDQPVVFINPQLDQLSEELIEWWDDCLCFPELLVKVLRHKSCRIRFWDMNWNQQQMHLAGELAELLQHEYDHLDGTLAVSRAIDEYSFALSSQRDRLK